MFPLALSGSSARRSFISMRAVLSLVVAVGIAPAGLAGCSSLFGEESDSTVIHSDAETPVADDGAEVSIVPYAAKLETAVQGPLRDKMERSMQLFELAGKPPSSIVQLRTRAEGDANRIEKLFRSEGYYDYTITHVIDESRNPVGVRIDADPGPLYTLTEYRIVYVDEADVDPNGARPRTVDALGVDLPQPARAAIVVETEGRVLKELGDRGFPLAEKVDRKVMVNHPDQTMTAELQIRSGPRVDFGAVTIEGTADVEASYVRRVANIPVGETFSLATVEQSRSRIFGTGLFDVVAIEVAKAPNRDGQLPLTVKVTENEHRTVAFGLSYSSTEGLGAEASWVHRNFFGRNERLETTARVSEIEQSIGATFAKPNWAVFDQTLKAALELRHSDTDAFEEQVVSSEVGVEKKLAENLTGSVGVSADYGTVTDRFGEKTTATFGLPGRLAYDVTDNPLDPSSGYKVGLELTPTVVTLDQQAYYLKSSVTGSAYYEAIDDRHLILAARGRVGSLLGARRADVPANRRFYSGGGGSIRGYQFQSVGPLDDENDPTGGLSVAEFSLEARFRFFEDYGLVPFFDGGSAFSNSEPFESSLQYAAGLGLRYFTPIGPVRFDVAFPLNGREAVDDTFEFYISLGQAF